MSGPRATRSTMFSTRDLWRWTWVQAARCFRIVIFGLELQVSMLGAEVVPAPVARLFHVRLSRRDWSSAVMRTARATREKAIAMVSGAGAGVSAAGAVIWRSMAWARRRRDSAICPEQTT